MILTRKHLTAAAVVIAVIGVFVGIRQYEIRQTIADNELKIILDAGHGAYA
ncbi:MAG: hypothetical protein HFE51_04555 [Clostridia bacterium]|nr:hypothetical protein [Clostridia bacterium]